MKRKPNQAKIAFAKWCEGNAAAVIAKLTEGLQLTCMVPVALDDDGTQLLIPIHAHLVTSSGALDLKNPESCKWIATIWSEVTAEWEVTTPEGQRVAILRSLRAFATIEPVHARNLAKAIRYDADTKVWSYHAGVDESAMLFAQWVNSMQEGSDQA